MLKYLIAFSAFLFSLPATAQYSNLTPAERAQADRDKARMGVAPAARKQSRKLETYLEPKQANMTKRLASAKTKARRSNTVRFGERIR